MREEARLSSALAFLVIAALIVGLILGVLAGVRVERAAAEQLRASSISIIRMAERD